jgi:hypothetical protein
MRIARRYGLITLALVVGAAGCPRQLDPPKSADTPAEAAPTPPLSARPAPDAVALFVDEERVAWLAPAQLQRPTPLASLLPASAREEGAWVALEAQADHRRDLFIPRPAKTYAGQQARVYARGPRLAIGMFRPAPAGAPAHVRQTLRSPTVELDGLKWIRVRLREPPTDDEDEDRRPPPRQIAIVVDGEAAPPVPLDVFPARGKKRRGGGDRSGDKVRPDQISLLSFLRDHANVPSFVEASLHDRDGVEMRVSAKDLASGVAKVELGRNRRDLVRVFAQGPGVPEDGLRGLIRVELKTR